jgi:hypothetical protein
MSCRAQRLAIAAFLALAPAVVTAQSTWQPTPAPSITAESATWFRAAEPIAWNGEVYYPAGAPQGFNGYEMVRSGSYRGIPLYTDTTVEPNSIVLVPIAGGRLQPYERRRDGMLAGTVGSRTPSLPTTVPTEAVGTTGNPMQALAAPARAAAYDENLIPPFAATVPVPAPVPVSMMAAEPVPRPAVAAEPAPVGTAGRLTAAPAISPARPETSVVPPTGLNAIWINFAGERWFAASRSIGYDPDVLEEIGTYRGFTVYRRSGDPSVIYVPASPGRLAAYTKRSGS